MPPLYIALPSFWVPMAVFVGTLIVFHLAFVWWWQLSEVSWRKVDYVWLGLSVLAIIGGASQLRGIIAGDDLAATQARWRDGISASISASEGMRRALCVHSSNPDPKGCAWYVHSLQLPRRISAAKPA